MSDAKVALGARLFADRRLSVNGSYSCQSCHAPQRAFTDGQARSRGVTGAELELNAPTLLNVAYHASLGWNDAGIRTLEQQMRGPLFNQHPPELGLAGREASSRRRSRPMPGSRRCSPRPFPDEARAVSMDNVIRAIAAYERTLIAGNSAFDRYVFAGEHEALDARQKRGMQLFFGSAGCAHCHGGINFAGPWVDREHPRATAIFADTGTGKSVRVPTLRNLPATRAVHARWPLRDPRGGARSLRAAGRRSRRRCAPAARATNYRRTRGARKLPAGIGRLALTTRAAKRRMLARLHARRAPFFQSFPAAAPGHAPVRRPGAGRGPGSRRRSPAAALPARGGCKRIAAARGGATGAHRWPVAAHLLRGIHRARRVERILGIQLLALGRLGGVPLHRLPQPA